MKKVTNLVFTIGLLACIVVNPVELKPASDSEKVTGTIDTGDRINRDLSCSLLQCEHGCNQSGEPGINGTCFCHQGYRISGPEKNRCKNINECGIWGTCSQQCTDFDGHFQCSCQAGFRLEANNKTCTPEDSNLLVVYALKKSIRVWNMKEAKGYSIMENMGQTIAVAVDVEHRKVLWTDITDKREAIYRTDIDGNVTNFEAVVDFGLELAEGLAYDWITGNIYFTDSNKRHIVACRSDGLQCTILVNELMDKPREITLHPNEGIMFWTNWGEKASIFKAEMNGAFQKPIVLNDLHWPNGLTVDHGNSRLYWSDAKHDVIESVDLTGGDRRIVRSAGESHHFSLDVFADTLFWSDWQANEIQSCNKFTGKDEKVVVHEGNSAGKLTKPNGLSIFHPAAQPKIRENQCATAGCSHICVLAVDNGYSCACPSGMTLDKTGKKCKDDEFTAKIVIANENQLGIYRVGSVGRDLIQEIRLKDKLMIGAVHYNSINETFFISDTFWRKIHEYNPKTKKLTTIVGGHIETITGLSLDVIGENLYWSDFSRRKIEVISLRTGARALISSEKDSPQDVLVVPEKKFLFVALTSGRFGRIMKYNMNGYNRSTLAKVSRGEPVSLAYNRELERVFWCDVSQETIEHISLDGREQTTVIKTSGAYSIASFGNRLFWTDRRTQLLNALSVLGSEAKDQPVFIGKDIDHHNTTYSSYIEGNFFAKISILQKKLNIYDHLMEQHECSVTKVGPMKCSHICLISNDEFIGTCLCPDGMELDPDFRTCKLKCFDDQFECTADKKCITRAWRCDGFNDCSGGEDEINCINTSMCDPTDFDCIMHEHDETESSTPPSISSNSTAVIPRPTTVVKPTTSERPRSRKPRPEELRPQDSRPKDSHNKDPRIKVISPFEEVGQNIDVESSGINENSNNNADDPIEINDRSLLSSEHESGSSSNGTATAIIISTIMILLIATVIIGFILHKRRISPKTLVQPYVQQLVKYVNRPVRRWYNNSGNNKGAQFRNEPAYDDAFDISTGHYGAGNYANPTYEEIDSAQNSQWNRNSSDSSKGESRSADSGILTVMDTDPNNLYEDIEDHYRAHSQKQKLISDDDGDLV